MRFALHLLGFAAGHFIVSFAIAIVAFGVDMDQLRSRSGTSRAAAAVHDVLWEPHDAMLRAIPHRWMIRNLWIIPVALIANSLLWGAAWYALWLLIRAGMRRRRIGS